MGNKFKFKLDGLLKVREFTEDRVKEELGRLVQEEVKILDRIKEIEIEIDTGYESQSELLKNNSNGKHAQFYPYYFAGKRADREKCETLLFNLRKKIEEKREELAKAMGDVKVLESLKEKKKAQYDKEKMKKEELEKDERTIMNFNKSF